MELNGSSNAQQRLIRAIKSEPHKISADLSDMPKGDLILIVDIHDEQGNVVSVKTRRVKYMDLVIPITGIELNTEKWTGFIGDTFRLTATVLPENATDKTIEWKSSDETIAKVDADGNVVTLKVGEAEIIASCGDVTASCHVTVNPILVETIELDPDSWSGTVGEEFQIVARILPENATDKTIEWKSSDETIATVDADGNVNILSSGECIITASTSDGSDLIAECSILVAHSGIDDIFVDENMTVDVYNLRVCIIRLNCNASDYQQLSSGIYILKTPTRSYIVIK